MFSTAPRPPVDLGQPVWRRRDPTTAIGYVVGLLFLPSQQALVRWQDGTATFEAPKDLVMVMRAA
jgi:hypothetical protein